MDRIIPHSKRKRWNLFKDFQYLDIFPYSIALILLAGDIYILNQFIKIACNMHKM
ncbi:MAG: hypothetical protein ACTHJ5_06475 [Ilyomonas sp.]